jgi:T4 RnlA family RNA ligase
MFTLEEAYTAARGRTEFAVKRLDDTVAFDYIVMLPDSFMVETDTEEGRRQAWIRRNFRGVTFCAYSGRIVSLPLHKFYNINQNEEASFHLHQHRQANIYEKLDGSMIHFYLVNGKLVSSTRRSPATLQAKEALSLVETDLRLKDLILETIANGMTPIFEFISPRNQIVVRYQQHKLVYLISRNRKTGQYIYETKYPDRASTYEISFGDIFNYLDRQEFEGYVCHLDNGEIYKVKTPWYVERHRAVDFLMKPLYKLYEVSLDGFMDDLIAIAAESYKSKLQSIDMEVQTDLLEQKSLYQNRFDAMVAFLGTEHQSLQDRLVDKDYRKKFVQAVQEQGLPLSIMMAMFGGKEPDSIIKKDLLTNYTEKYTGKIWSENE